jgi:hypothetical protein
VKEEVWLEELLRMQRSRNKRRGSSARLGNGGIRALHRARRGASRVEDD